MNFQSIKPVETDKTYIDLAFSKARTKVTKKKFEGTTTDRVKMRESIKLDIVRDDLNTRLKKILAEFPSFDSLPEFYHKLAQLTLDYRELKKSLGAVRWAVKQIAKFHRLYAAKVAKANSQEFAKERSKEFYGRISSIMNQIKKQLVYLDECRRIMKTYPDIKNMFTVCLYGYPNIGKTTLLNKLTGSNAKIAGYSFTTKTVNCSYLEEDGVKIQVLDVPGTLARSDKMNVIELQADLVLNEVANVVVYLFDITEPFPLEKQQALYNKVKKLKKTFVYVSKQDILSDEQIKEIPDLKVPVMSIEEIKTEILKLGKVHQEEQAKLAILEKEAKAAAAAAEELEKSKDDFDPELDAAFD